MQRFRYIPPGPEEQRAFVVQFAGSLAGLLLLGGLWYWTRRGLGHAELIGAALAVIWLLARTAWALETKARRAQQAEIAYDEDGLHLTDSNGVTRFVKWEEIAEPSVIGGLAVQWPDGRLAVGAREIENGMELVEAVCAEYGRRHDDGRKPPSNFIPLTPR